jgi:hypothetical protein
MDLKYNINKIHSDLISQFYTNDVKIKEKSNLKFGKYFEISIIKEEKEFKAILPMSSLNNYTFEWSYYSNPLNEDSHLVERSSSIDTFSSEVKNIFDKNRFSKDYLDKVNK